MLNMGIVDSALEKLASGAQDVDEKLHIGGGFYITVQAPYRCVQVRRYFRKGDLTLPSRVGVSLRETEWKNFKEAVKEVESILPEISSIMPCDYDHGNQMAYLECPECCPFTCTDYMLATPGSPPPPPLSPAEVETKRPRMRLDFN